MFAAVFSPNVEWAEALGKTIIEKCVPKGRYVEVEVFGCPNKLISHIGQKAVGTVIMSADKLDDLSYAKRISEKGVRLILLTDSNDVAVKAYSLNPEYCSYKKLSDDDYEHITSVIFSSSKRE